MWFAIGEIFGARRGARGGSAVAGPGRQAAKIGILTLTFHAATSARRR